MVVDVPQSGVVVCTSARELPGSLAAKVYRMPVRQPAFPVIPGCARSGADPESRSGAPCVWIPGSREDARPGMTVKP
jgi:hypothetical protein